MRSIVWSLVALLAGAIPAAGRDLVVNNATGKPFPTIREALCAAGPGDRIVLVNTGQPYRECITLAGSRVSGSDAGPLVLAGNGAVLDGSAPIPPGAWQNYENTVFRFRPRVPGNQQLFVSGRPAPYVPPELGTHLPPRLKPLEWSLVEGVIYFAVEPSKMPFDYELSCAAMETGITLWHVQRVAIVDLVVQGFRVDGIQAVNSARDIQITNVTCRGNGRSGITVGGASRVTIEGSTIGDNRTAQLLTLPISETHIFQSDLLPLTAPAWVDHGGRVFVESKPVQGGLPEIRGGE